MGSAKALIHLPASARVLAVWRKCYKGKAGQGTSQAARTREERARAGDVVVCTSCPMSCNLPLRIACRAFRWPTGYPFTGLHGKGVASMLPMGASPHGHSTADPGELCSLSSPCFRGRVHTPLLLVLDDRRCGSITQVLPARASRLQVRNAARTAQHGSGRPSTPHVMWA